MGKKCSKYPHRKLTSRAFVRAHCSNFWIQRSLPAFEWSQHFSLFGRKSGSVETVSFVIGMPGCGRNGFLDAER